MPNDRPGACLDKHLDFLNKLRESGKVNMFVAAIPLRESYPELTHRQARDIVVYWMRTFESLAARVTDAD